MIWCMKPFRFGIVGGQASDLKTWAGLARRAEELGYDTLVSPDPQFELDPFTTLSAAAAVTTSLHVGTFVAVDGFRDRRLLDWQARSLHTLTGGRFELGLGTGRPDAAATVAKLGGEFGTPRDRFTRLAETVAHLKRQPDRPPLLLAAGGPRMLEFAAREADIVTLAVMPNTTEEELKSVVDGFWSAAGGREVELAMNLLAIGDGPAPWLEQFIGVGLSELVAGGAVSVLPAPPHEAAEVLRRRQERFGISYFTINSGYLDQFAPVIELLR
jgi:alkanesulfonate monooxygenase SsuD/methylene tetrahydromethanopterin reductase-like flavin-dependent oxidoreductase (luciferase family)